MKNVKKYFMTTVFMLVAFFAFGTIKVNAAESGIAYKVDLGTVNVGYTEKPMGYINVHNNGTEAWAIWNVTVDREDIFNINGTNHDYVEPAYDSYEQYYVTAETGLLAGTYTGKITVATMSGYTMETTVTLKVADPSAKNNVLVTDATDFINAVNKTNAEDSADLIKLQNNIGGGNSGTTMSLLPYIPVREGYTFNGWNTKKDGSGEIYNYVYWRFWDKDEKTDKEFDKDTLIKEENGYERYKNVNLYASWTKTSGEPEQPVKETVKEIQSTGETKAKIEFAKEVSKDYKLDIKPVEVKKDLTNKNVKYVVDINVLENNQIVKISDTKMKIRIALPEDLKGFNKYEVVYISNDEIKETIPATIEDGYIVFETSHLSQYGIIATNVEGKTEQTKNETNNPKTGDNITTNIMLFVASIATIGTLTLVNRKKVRE